jgi:hypothetical protein
MKTVILASASGKSSTTTVAMEDDRSETRDSCYFPGCRKDANCNCKICWASISATLDLMPISCQKSTLTKLSNSRPGRDAERTPISFNSSILSTPRSSPDRLPASPVVISKARLNLDEKMGKSEGDWGLRGLFFQIGVGFELGFCGEIWVFFWGFWAFPTRVVNGYSQEHWREIMGYERFEGKAEISTERAARSC